MSWIIYNTDDRSNVSVFIIISDVKWRICLSTADSDDGATNTAHLDSSLDPDESLLSPAGAPGVLHQPEVNTVLRAVADHSHGVVRLGSGGTTGENSSLVIMMVRSGDTKAR